MVTARSVEANLAALHARIERASLRAGRDPASVKLVAVSKTFPAEAVIAAYSAGQREFGENWIQEAGQKVRAVAAAGCDAAWHLIGHLQTNKVRLAIGLFATIHSVDSLHLATALNDRLNTPYPVLVEINVVGEASKTGLPFDTAESTVEAIRGLPNLNVRGLMTVPPLLSDPEDARPVFRRLADLARRLELPELSMGMSNDFEVAIEEGATIVRVGTAIFGHRG